MKHECKECEGQGYIEEVCGSCNGSGEGHHSNKVCRPCRGKGGRNAECDKCKGEGVVIDPECYECGEVLTEEEYNEGNTCTACNEMADGAVREANK